MLQELESSLYEDLYLELKTKADHLDCTLDEEVRTNVYFIYDLISELNSCQTKEEVLEILTFNRCDAQTIWQLLDYLRDKSIYRTKFLEDFLREMYYIFNGRKFAEAPIQEFYQTLLEKLGIKDLDYELGENGNALVREYWNEISQKNSYRKEFVMEYNNAYDQQDIYFRCDGINFKKLEDFKEYRQDGLQLIFIPSAILPFTSICANVKDKRFTIMRKDKFVELGLDLTKFSKIENPKEINEIKYPIQDKNLNSALVSMCYGLENKPEELLEILTTPNTSFISKLYDDLPDRDKEGVYSLCDLINACSLRQLTLITMIDYKLEAICWSKECINYLKSVVNYFKKYMEDKDSSTLIDSVVKLTIESKNL